MEAHLPDEERFRLLSRTQQERDDDMARLAGTCREACNALLAQDPTLTLKRGYYYCLIWGERQHWWLTKPDGTIVDPTAGQFPSNGLGPYVEFDGTITCEQCGKDVKEEDAYMVEHHAYCSDSCYGKDVLGDDYYSLCRSR